MSRDSTATYIHMHASHHADLFEEFCHPPSSTNQQVHSNTSANGQTNPNTQPSNNDPGMIQIPGHFLPFEEIQLPPHLMPLNPEDEDDVVPDMHAAFGINRALNGPGGSGPIHASGEGSGRGAHQESVWRDLGLEKLLDGNGSGKITGEMTAAKREGRKTGLLLMR